MAVELLTVFYSEPKKLKRILLINILFIKGGNLGFLVYLELAEF